MRSKHGLEFCLGGGLSLAAPVVFVAGGADTVAIALLAVLLVGLVRVTRVGLEAMRLRRHPLWRVLTSGGCYWCGAAVGSIVAWNIALALAAPGLELGVGFSDFREVWVAAAVSVAVVASVTTVLHSLRTRALR